MKKIVVWGITDIIWDNLRSHIDFNKTEILFFIDNNVSRQNSGFGGKEVLGFQKDVCQRLAEADAVLVTAFSGYREIKEKLCEAGYPKSKIQIYITASMVKYNLGVIDNIDYELIDAIYRKPWEKRIQLSEYQYWYKEYCNCNKEQIVLEGRWSEMGALISHAGGGMPNGKREPITNSKEALMYSFGENFKLIECDVINTKWNEMILAHDWEHYYCVKREPNLTAVNMEDMLNLLWQYPQSHVLIDLKWKDYEDYTYCIWQMERIMKRIAGNEESFRRFQKQIIMEAYDEETIRCAQGYGFDVFFTLYRNEERRNVLKTVVLCHKYNISAVGYPDWLLEEFKKSFQLIKDKGITIWIYSCNSAEEFRKLQEMGVDGIFTDYLTYRDII